MKARYAKNRNFDFEINLLPFISALAICISFLLLTAVWSQVGTLSMSQAFGTSGAGTTKNPQAIWVQFENNGSVVVSVKESDQLKDSLKFVNLRAKKSRPDLIAIENFAKKVKSALPDLNVGLLLPSAYSSYEDVIFVMNSLKQLNIQDIGIAPL